MAPVIAPDELRIGQQEPAPGRDAVGLVAEALGERLGQVLDRHRAQQLGVDGRHAVGAVRADNGQVGHADVLDRAFLDEAHARQSPFVAREAGAHRVEEPAVDLEDDLQMTRQHLLEPLDRPLLQGFGQERVVRVGERLLGEVPGLVPSQVRIVEEDAHQLGDGQGRVRVVELDGDLVGQRAPVGVALPEAPHEIGQRAGDQEILLHEAQRLSHARRVVGIEHPRQGFGGERLGHRADELAVAEYLEIEVVRRRRGPQSERVDALAAVAHHGAIERNADQAGRAAVDRAQGPSPHLERAAELDLHLLVRARDLPGVGAAQPVVRALLLPAGLDDLPEDAVFVAEPIAHGRELHRGHRVEEARGEPPEPPIAQARVGLLIEQAQPVEVLLRDHLLRDGIEQEVRDIVGQRPADQKLHREVVDALGVLALVRGLRPQPALREDVPHRAREGLEALTGAGCPWIEHVVEHEMPVVERVARPREVDGAAPVLPQKGRHLVGSYRRPRGRHLLSAHRPVLSLSAHRRFRFLLECSAGPLPKTLTDQLGGMTTARP